MKATMAWRCRACDGFGERLLVCSGLLKTMTYVVLKQFVPAGSSSSVPADYVSAGHVLVTLGGIKDHNFGGPREMVDLINPHGFTLNDPQGRLKSDLAWVSQVLKIHTNDNVADLLTKAFDGPRFEYLVVHIGMVYILSAGRLVSAGRTMVLLVVILSAGRLVSAGRTMVLLVVILSAGRLVSAGRTMILLVVILPAGCFVSAGCMFLLSAWFLLLDDSFCWLNIFMLLELFMLPIHLFMLLDWFVLFDIAGWLVSATSHLVSAGSLHSCWCNNVSAA
ncbi:hypothetical protein Tco_0544176 [Tanacetum coccineum]